MTPLPNVTHLASFAQCCARLGIAPATFRARLLAGLLPGPVVGQYPRPTLGRPRAEDSARWDLDAVVAAWDALRHAPDAPQ